MDDGSDQSELGLALKHLRSDGTFRWKSRGDYGRMQEWDDAKSALNALGITYEELQLFHPDPPDCIAKIDGQLWAIEVTELLHRETMERRMKIAAQAAQVRNGRCPLSGPHHEWTDGEAIQAIQQSIKGKDGKTYLGGPYDHILIVVRRRNAS